ncbi:aldehyde dehydrogenase [Persicitalea jodogahamensis]|uniref:aldehyde dehydrogenase (NAD(+)) n=1 Tax=Persicitalea jodogahamensis TaxID=402147 RepID=A0A8J3D0A6_9BACT|nr:aldehyde dehydrogenase family protein [Persicitalea jodogahamensis]GHB56377.1 aldehyde dehydrogenase [Persicitalea jodogahamensis]
MTQLNDFLNLLNIKTQNPGLSTGQESWDGQGVLLESYSPVNGRCIASTKEASREDYDRVISTAQAAFKEWRQKPAPLRGEIVRQMGERFRQNKQALGELVSYEMGKSLQEGLGEVQEIIDICDFAVGLSRQLYGLTMHSERPAHRMYEQWHPLGVVGIISAFNFPVAVWSWNAMIAWVCGDVCIWKPSEKTPLTAIACQNIIIDVLKANNVPEGVSCLVVGGRNVGEWIADDARIALVSATGSTRMGRAVAESVGRRLGKSLLELGGNNAIIVTPEADLTVAIPAIVFGAVGTAGQRCTSTRRLIVHASIYDEMKQRLQKAYNQLRIGDPLNANNHVGPLIDEQAVASYEATVREVLSQGGAFVIEPEVLRGDGFGSGCYVRPCVAEAENNWAIVQQETFAPILYLIKYNTLEEAIEIQNNVPQGLSSAIFTLNMREAERFLSASGSDCGIANVNIGTSGAEIGGAFGGEKETGGGRESGSDAWKAYMRRQTNTLNYGTDLPLAQGITFEL